MHYKLIRSTSFFLTEPEEGKSFAVGHIAFAYLSGKGSARLLKTGLNIPLIATLAVIPDVDILFHGLIEHRGPTHSIITALIIFAPFFALYRRAAFPYFVALVQHSLVGDYLAGGRIQLFWPITTQYFGFTMEITSLTNVAIEWTMFLASIALLFRTKDVALFFQPHLSSLILAIPTFTVLLPPILSFPLDVPVLLIPPHVAYAIMFLAAILLALSQVFRPRRDGNSDVTFKNEQESAS